jgi:cell division protein FtsW
VQAFFNMTVALDLVPSKGIPLPMISAGGSSMMATLISLGMVLSVSERAG